MPNSLNKKPNDKCKILLWISNAILFFTFFFHFFLFHFFLFFTNPQNNMHSLNDSWKLVVPDFLDFRDFNGNVDHKNDDESLSLFLLLEFIASTFNVQCLLNESELKRWMTNLKASQDLNTINWTKYLAIIFEWSSKEDTFRIFGTCIAVRKNIEMSNWIIIISDEAD